MATATTPILTEKPPPFPTRRPEVIAAAQNFLAEKAWTRLEGAPETEAALRDYHGGGTVWYLSSGTAALEAIMLGHGIGPGDEVITTPYTWGATVSAILAIGAIPVFADIEKYSARIDPDSVRNLLSPRTKAILGVHLYGHPCDAAQLREIADEHGITFFEDGSQAHGAKLHGQRVGRFGHASAFSCMGLKPLAGTEGGYAIFEDPAAAERAFLYGRHPRGIAPDRVQVLEAQGLLDSLQLGWRPCALGAELVRVALPFLDEENHARRENAQTLRDHLGEVPGLTLFGELPGAEGVYHLLSIVYDEDVGKVSFEEFRKGLQQTGAGGFLYIPTPIHRMKRLSPRGYEGPRVLWHEQLLRAGVDYSDTYCPHADWRAARAVEFGFNWTLPNPAAMEQLATCFRTAAGV